MTKSKKSYTHEDDLPVLGVEPYIELIQMSSSSDTNREDAKHLVFFHLDLH
ncbi:hypothetical protein [Lysinibacillus capsici]|uniref:hypothetical protein n=1 Tax=Lysinibacillus capsici TaxID=2115968 RepID=UPI00325FB3F0